MKNVFVCILIVFCSVNVNAQQNQGHFIFGGGGNLPIRPNPFNDFWKSGINYGGGVYRNIDDVVAFGIDVNYSEIEMEGIYTKSFENPSEIGKVKMLTILPTLRVTPNLDGIFTPYFEVGAGLYRILFEEVDYYELGVLKGEKPIWGIQIGNEVQHLLGLNLGVGVQIHISKYANLLIGGNIVVGAAEEISFLSPLSSDRIDFNALVLVPFKLRIRF